MEERSYSTPQGTIRYWISRENPGKPWLVFLPGLTADHTLFEKQLEFFCSRCNCFVWDAPGHGLSRPFTLAFTMRDLAAYLHGIFDAEKISSPVLIGQSLGGYMSQVYMDRYPGEVSGFVSVDSCSMSRKYYTAWELALLRKTRGMYMSIPLTDAAFIGAGQWTYALIAGILAAIGGIIADFCFRFGIREFLIKAPQVAKDLKAAIE